MSYKRLCWKEGQAKRRWKEQLLIEVLHNSFAEKIYIIHKKSFDGVVSPKYVSSTDDFIQILRKVLVQLFYGTPLVGSSCILLQQPSILNALMTNVPLHRR